MVLCDVTDFPGCPKAGFHTPKSFALEERLLESGSHRREAPRTQHGREFAGMGSSRSRGDARIAGRLYIVYVVLAVAGAVLKSLEMSLVATAAYFVLAVQLYRLVAPIDRRVAFVLLPLAALGCVVQGIGMVESDRDLQRFAVMFFGLFLVALGYLVARSGFFPRAIGVWLVLAGIGWCAVVLIRDLSFSVSVAVQGFGGLSEVALALWLLFGGDARPRPSRGGSPGS